MNFETLMKAIEIASDMMKTGKNDFQVRILIKH